MNQPTDKVVEQKLNGTLKGTGMEKAGLFPLDPQLQALILPAMVGRLTPEVIHDINNQLTGILGYAELLLMKKVEDPGIRNGLKNILLSAEKSKVLLDNLLLLSRVERPLDSLSNVNFLLEKVLTMRSAALRHRQIEFILELKNDLPTIILDGARFQKTVLYLIFKAEEILDDQPQGKKLIFSSMFKASPPEIIIKISDHESASMANPLRPLSELVQENISPDLGIRLGLVEAGQWIETLGGRIEWDSDRGKGTTFLIHLPVKEDQEA